MNIIGGPKTCPREMINSGQCFVYDDKILLSVWNGSGFSSVDLKSGEFVKVHENAAVNPIETELRWSYEDQ